MKKFLCEQDKEEFEQEQRINEWLGKRKSKWDHIDFIRQRYGRKGSHRYHGHLSTQSLSMEIGEDGTGTLEDLIPGADGRDLEDGDPDFHLRAAVENKIDNYLAALGFDEELSEWLVKTLKSSESTKQARLRKSQIDSESWEQLTNFEE